jgi:hypothetical protein
MVADLIVGFNAFKERFASRVTKERPGHICVDYIEGPLKYLKNEWRFEPRRKGGPKSISRSISRSSQRYSRLWPARCRPSVDGG